MEHKIGEMFEYNGEWYQCIVGNGCENCAFNGRKCYTVVDNGDPIGECCADRRKDDKDVIFKKLEKAGEPIEFSRELCFQRYQLADSTAFYEGDTRLFFNAPTKTFVYIEIKTKEDMEDNKKQTSLNSTKGIYEKFKGKTVQCLVNNKDGDLVNGYGIVCGYRDKYLIIGFTNEYEGCIKSFTDNVFLENRDFLSYRFWNISHVDDKPFIKPFNLEAAKAGKPVCTRDGRKARIICFDRDWDRNIVALVSDPLGESVHYYLSNGKVDFDKQNYNDLMMLPEKKEGWAVIRKSDIYETEEQAEEVLNSRVGVMIRKINWEE